MFLLWKWSLIEGIFIISWDTNTTWWYFLPLQIVFYSAIKLHIYGWTTLCVRACHCVWVCVLPAVSHQVSMWRLNKDVVHIEQNVHEVLSGHGPAICILPLMLYTQIQVHNVIDPVFVFCFLFVSFLVLINRAHPKYSLTVPLSCRSHGGWADQSGVLVYGLSSRYCGWDHP